MAGHKVAHATLKGPSVIKEIIIASVLGLAAGGLWKMHHWTNRGRSGHYITCSRRMKSVSLPKNRSSDIFKHGSLESHVGAIEALIGTIPARSRHRSCDDYDDDNDEEAALAAAALQNEEEEEKPKKVKKSNVTVANPDQYLWEKDYSSFASALHPLRHI